MNNTPAGLPSIGYDRNADRPDFAECPECRKDLVSGFEVDGFCSEACRNAALATVYDTSADDSWDGETADVPEFTWDRAVEVMNARTRGRK